MVCWNRQLLPQEPPGCLTHRFPAHQLKTAAVIKMLISPMCKITPFLPPYQIKIGYVRLEILPQYIQLGGLTAEIVFVVRIMNSGNTYPAVSLVIFLLIPPPPLVVFGVIFWRCWCWCCWCFVVVVVTTAAHTLCFPPLSSFQIKRLPWTTVHGRFIPPFLVLFLHVTGSEIILSYFKTHAAPPSTPIVVVDIIKLIVEVYQR